MRPLLNHSATYAHKKFNRVVTLQHKGNVVAFAEADSVLYYNVLDLNQQTLAKEEKAGQESAGEGQPVWNDAQCWTGFRALPLPDEVRLVGMSLITIKKKDLNQAGSWSVLSGGQYIYLFRSIGERIYANRYLLAAGPAPVEKSNPGSEEETGQDVRVSMRLVMKPEARFRRSRMKETPLGANDNPSYQDMDGMAFIEPIMDFHYRLQPHNGLFAVCQGPSHIPGRHRWQFLYFETKKEGPNTQQFFRSVSILTSEDGWADLSDVKDPKFRIGIGKEQFLSLAAMPAALIYRPLEKVNDAGADEEQCLPTAPRLLFAGAMAGKYDGTNDSDRLVVIDFPLDTQGDGSPVFPSKTGDESELYIPIVKKTKDGAIDVKPDATKPPWVSLSPEMGALDWLSAKQPATLLDSADGRIHVYTADASGNLLSAQYDYSAFKRASCELDWVAGSGDSKQTGKLVLQAREAGAEMNGITFGYGLIGGNAPAYDFSASENGAKIEQWNNVPRPLELTKFSAFINGQPSNYPQKAEIVNLQSGRIGHSMGSGLVRAIPKSLPSNGEAAIIQIPSEQTKSFTLSGGASGGWTTGQYKTAAQFTGSNLASASLKNATPQALIGAGDFTVETWLRPAGEQGSERILSIKGADSQPENACVMGITQKIDGQVLSLDQSGSKFTIPEAAIKETSSNLSGFTISFWANLGPASKVNTDWSTLLYFKEEGKEDGISIKCQRYGDKSFQLEVSCPKDWGTMQYTLQNNPGKYYYPREITVYSPSQLEDAWCLFTLVGAFGNFSNEITLQLYLNGQPQVTDNSIPHLSLNGYLSLKGLSFTPVSSHPSSIASVALWERALSANEVSNLHNSKTGVSHNDANLLGLWLFADQAGRPVSNSATSSLAKTQNTASWQGTLTNCSLLPAPARLFAGAGYHQVESRDHVIHSTLWNHAAAVCTGNYALNFNGRQKAACAESEGLNPGEGFSIDGIISVKTIAAKQYIFAKTDGKQRHSYALGIQNGMLFLDVALENPDKKTRRIQLLSSQVIKPNKAYYFAAGCRFAVASRPLGASEGENKIDAIFQYLETAPQQSTLLTFMNVTDLEEGTTHSDAVLSAQGSIEPGFYLESPPVAGLNKEFKYTIPYLGSGDFKILEGPSGMKVDSSGNISGWTPGNIDKTGHQVRIQAKNYYGASTLAFNLKVDQDASNLSPAKSHSVLFDGEWRFHDTGKLPAVAGCLNAQAVENQDDSERGFLQGTIGLLRFWDRYLEADAEQLALRVDVPTYMVPPAANWPMNAGKEKKAKDTEGTAHLDLDSVYMWVPSRLTAQIALYVDGDRIETRPAKAADIGGYGVTPDKIIVGARETGTKAKPAFADHFQGNLAELRIWDQARTEEEILDNMFMRQLKGEDGLVGYWPFQDGQGTAAKAQGNEKIDLALTAGSWEKSWSPAKGQPFAPPVGNESPLVMDSLAGIETGWRAQGNNVLGAVEYGDLQADEEGLLQGVLKRCYAYVDHTTKACVLATGFKVGMLDTHYLGQIQTQPQLHGFIEGAPPLPSENMTTPYYISPTTYQTYTGASSIQLAEADNTIRTYSAEKDNGLNMSLAVNLGAQFGVGFEAGLGFYADVLESKLKIGMSSSLDANYGWQSGAQVETGSTKTLSNELTASGNWEAEQPHPVKGSIYEAFGRRYVPDNIGYALVKSRVANLYALRLRGSGTLAAMQIVPDPDIPEDFNIIIFNINKNYTKQGTLDGWIGSHKDTECLSGDQQKGSYYKPGEAYSLIAQIEEAEARLEADYQQFDLNKEIFGAIAEGIKDVVDYGPQDRAEWKKKRRKRNLVNSYVWTAAGGLYAEEEQTMVSRHESAGCSFDLSSMAGLAWDMELQPGFYMDGHALFGSSIHTSVHKEKSEGSDFELKVHIDADGFLGKWTDGKYDGNNTPGKVLAYRFKTFYLAPDKSYFDALFNEVIDPDWLKNDPSADAAAMRAAKARPNEVWRVMHRVTYVNRVPQDKAHLAQDISEPSRPVIGQAGNDQLIQKIVEKAKSKSGSLSQKVGQAVQDFLNKDLPTLSTLWSQLCNSTADADKTEKATIERAVFTYMKEQQTEKAEELTNSND